MPAQIDSSTGKPVVLSPEIVEAAQIQSRNRTPTAIDTIEDSGLEDMSVGCCLCFCWELVSSIISGLFVMICELYKTLSPTPPTQGSADS